MRTVEPSNHRHYLGFANFDEDRMGIAPSHFLRIADTRLARPLTPGDVVIYLQSTDGWMDNVCATCSHQRSLGIWGYKNRSGHNYGEYTYTRYSKLDMWDNGAIDRVNRTVRLRDPLPKGFGNPDHPAGTWPVGHAVSNVQSGNTYQYCAVSGVATPTTWTRYAGSIRGVNHTGKGDNCSFPPGTAFTRPLILYGHTPSIPGTTLNEPVTPSPTTLDLAHLRWVRVK
jgi:hypothetical protein